MAATTRHRVTVDEGSVNRTIPHDPEVDRTLTGAEESANCIVGGQSVLLADLVLGCILPEFFDRAWSCRVVLVLVAPQCFFADTVLRGEPDAIVNR